MKLILTALMSMIIAQAFCQQTGAMATDPSEYNAIGTAPLPIGSQIPNIVDLSPSMPPVGHQGQLNSCVAWAVAYANYSYLNRLRTNCSYQTPGALNTDCLFSPLYIYNQINNGQNGGTFFLRAFDIMKQQGVATLTDMPYSNNYLIQPSQTARLNASRNKIESYWQLGRTGADILTEAKAFLAIGLPVIASVKVENYLRNQQVYYPNPYVWNSMSGQPNQMSHAILIVGYDDTTQRFKFLNSWGTNWGNAGYGYISYNVFPYAVNEAFIIKTGTSTTQTTNLLAKDSKFVDQSDINAGLNLQLSNVQHTIFPTPPTMQQYDNATFTFQGTFNIPAGIGRTAQIVIYFYYRNPDGSKGQIIRSPDPMFRTLIGQTVVGTPLLDITNGVNNLGFYATMRYSALGVQGGYPYRPPITSYLTAEPVLLVDNFPVRIAQRHDFFVTR